VSSNHNSDAFDLERDLPTSPEDVPVLARLRAASPAWLAGGAPVIAADATRRALAARATARDTWLPFELP
jgi:hypothetical protein